MKKIILVLIVILLLCPLAADQNADNRKYLILLDENIITTIEMMDAFHKKSELIYQDIEHGQDYDQFLLSMTMECSNLLENIRNADVLTAEEREIRIASLIATIKSDVEFSNADVTESKDRENSLYLNNIQINLKSQKATLLKHMIKEEEIILELGKITENYMRLHTHNFLFSLILNFTQDSEYLSKINRNYLTKVIRSVDQTLQHK